MSQLSLKIVGSDMDDGLARLDVFAEFCDTVRRCLAISEKIVSEGKKPRIEYRIVSMSIGSAELAITPVCSESQSPELGEQVTGYFEDAVDSIERGILPPRMSSSDCLAFAKLASPSDKHCTVQIGRVKLTHSYRENLASFLSSTLSTAGSFSGVIERLNVHIGAQFTMYSDLGINIACDFHESLLETVKKVIKRKVTAYGRFDYDAKTRVPFHAKVDRIEIHPKDEELPSLEDLRNALKADRNIDAVKYVKDLRENDVFLRDLSRKGEN